MAGEGAVEGIIHIAGLDVQVGDQLRQRCSWCGSVILDVDTARVAFQVVEGQEGYKVSTWPVGALIGMNGAVTWVVEHEDGKQLPPNACAQVPHEVTA